MTRQAKIGSNTPVSFTHGGGQVDTDIVIEWDFDNDGDFDESVEDITGLVLSAQTFQGRDWPSQLTGRSAPGTLDLEVLNEDDRFNFFNAASPLNQPPFSLDNGRKIRVRTATATDTWPTLLAQDRFRGGGDLGETENGLTWEHGVPPDFNAVFARVNDCAQALSPLGLRALAVVDLGVEDAFVQIRIKTNDYINSVGIVYRYLDDENYGRIYITNGFIVDEEVTAGVPSTVTTAWSIEDARENIMFGIHANGTSINHYLDGAFVQSSNPANVRDTTDTKFGLFQNFVGQRAPQVAEFYAWSGRPQRDEGIIWTGSVTKVIPFVAPNDAKQASIEAEGELSKPALADIVDIPASVGAIGTDPGSKTGEMIGNVLGGLDLLHPGGDIDSGAVGMGAVAVDSQKALTFMRRMEEVEFGFLKESNEGTIEFENQGHRNLIQVDSGFSDAPGSQFVYSDLDLLDWRRELINRVSSSLSPVTPQRKNLFGSQLSNAAGVATDVSISMPNDTTNNGEPGDLILLQIASTVQTAGVNWLTPPDFVNLADKGDVLGRERWYAHVLTEATISQSILFYDDTEPAGGAYAWIMYHFDKDTWFGSIDSGVAIASSFGFGPPNTEAFARLGTNNPPVLLPPWGRNQPSYFITTRSGFVASTATALVDAANTAQAPHGYREMGSTLVEGSGTNDFDVCLQRAVREGVSGVEDPTPFGTRFENFDYLDGTTVAVRGFAGSPPETSGGQVVIAEDLDSQERHRIVVNHTNPAEFFANATAANSYNSQILARYGQPRPILRISFFASRSAAYRAQAFRKRVSDKIRLTATNNAGQGIDDTFAIESISHRWSEGLKLWTVTWELSRSAPGIPLI